MDRYAGSDMVSYMVSDFKILIIQAQLFKGLGFRPSLRSIAIRSADATAPSRLVLLKKLRGLASGCRSWSLGYYMGGCQNDGPFLGTPKIRCRMIIGTQKGTIILTTTHIITGFYRGYTGYNGKENGDYHLGCGL